MKDNGFQETLEDGRLVVGMAWSRYCSCSNYCFMVRHIDQRMGRRSRQGE